jgi:hypothetical protein
MDNAIAVWFLGLLCAGLYLMLSGQIGLGIMAFLLLFASIKIVNG